MLQENAIRGAMTLLTADAEIEVWLWKTEALFSSKHRHCSAGLSLAVMENKRCVLTVEDHFHGSL